MFAELAILAKSTIFQIIIAAEGEDQLRVNVIPKAVEGQNPALSTPLSLVGTPAELDAEFLTHLTGYANKRLSLAEQLENTKLVMDAALKEAQEKAKAKPAAKVKSAAPAASTTSAGDDGLDDDQPFEDATAGVPTATVFSARKLNDSAEINLFS